MQLTQNVWNCSRKVLGLFWLCFLLFGTPSLSNVLVVLLFPCCRQLVLGFFLLLSCLLMSKSSLTLLVSSHMVDCMWFSLFVLERKWRGSEWLFFSLFLSFMSLALLFKGWGFSSSLSPFFFVSIPHLFMPFKFGPSLFVSSTLGPQISLLFCVCCRLSSSSLFRLHLFTGKLFPFEKWIPGKVNYFQMFGSIMKNELKNTFQYLVVLWKMNWKIIY